MPEMDGLAVIEKLRADPTTRRIPVVALTSATAAHANALVRARCIGFIAKPFTPTEFLRLIVEFLHVTIAGSRHDPGRSSSGSTAPMLRPDSSHERKAHRDLVE